MTREQKLLVNVLASAKLVVLHKEDNLMDLRAIIDHLSSAMDMYIRESSADSGSQELSCNTCFNSCKEESACVNDHHFRWIPKE